MADIKSSPSRLSGLPPELFELVAEEVDSEDLFALRSTCREIGHKDHRTFLDVHFSSKAFLLSSPESMRMLVDLSKHNIFGPAIQRINLHVQMISTQSHYYTIRRDHGDEAALNREQRLELREGRRQYQQVADAHRQFWKLKAWVAPLTEALQNVKNSRGSVKLSLVYYQSSKDIGVLTKTLSGRKVLDRRLGHDLETEWLDFAGEEQASLMDAIGLGGCPVTEFVLGKQHLDTFNRSQLSNFYDFAAITDKTLFAGLRMLDVSLWVKHWRPYPEAEEGVRRQRWQMRLLIQFLSGAKHLEKLTLRCGYGKNFHCFQGFALVAKLPKIKELTLILLEPRPGDLLIFCIQHRSTLKRLGVSPPQRPPHLMKGWREHMSDWDPMENLREATDRLCPGVAVVPHQIKPSEYSQ
ncbi:hypothetical protein LTR56_021372 [Elasticomyces elasticus]|nr:hypothetical protein LTR56_021372 [Elasticomyces elasticus]KAK3625160.1 hypothetical protein LTR22_023661 [Elasticomyces elasticus]KAK4921014.1 hypothetical protein LTR49_011558 [Elasticomyces elasticus]KAK5759481.1 hypothetical protein LTS12_010339 [Elasticomyces elasticus]